MANFVNSMANFISSITVKTKYGAMAATVTPFVIFASIYVACAYTIRARRKPEKIQNKIVLTRSVSVGMLHGGKLALERLVECHNARADETSSEKAVTNLEDLLGQQHPDFKKLQSTVARLEMTRNEAAAVQILRKALDKALNEGKPHEAYEIEMLLVEMLIYKGDIEESLRCKCLEEPKITDVRRPLYKAIIYIMLENRKEAISYWEQFNHLRKNFQWPPDLQDHQLYEVIENFDSFAKVVRLLKNDIEKNKKTK